METKSTIASRPNILRVAVVTGIILLLPFLAMQFNWQVADPGNGTDGVNWTLSDFIVMGTLLMSVGLTYELIIKRVANSRRRRLWTVALALGFLWLWAELAVGVFTNWGS
jgi:predicted cobalt transporter CbtA